MHVLLCMLTLDFICLMISFQTSYTSILAFKVESNFAVLVKVALLVLLGSLEMIFGILDKLLDVLVQSQ